MLALKEWQPIVWACGNCNQTVLFRKGGILDSRFQIRGTTNEEMYAFFPTTFHSDSSMLKPSLTVQQNKDVKDLPEISIDYVFRITGSWYSYDPDIGEKLDDFHVYGPGFFRTRLQYKPEKPLTILEIQTYALDDPIIIRNIDALWGCFSWLNLNDIEEGVITWPPGLKSGEDLALTKSHECISDFASRQQILRERLSYLDTIVPID
jgi:hypothetical protein